jgi:chromosome segregation ATPase
LYQDWLKSVPAPAEALILGLLDWAQDNATAAISQERAEIEARATEIAQAQAAWLAAKALFQTRISELAERNQGLNDETASLRADGRTVAQANRDLRADLAGQTQALAVATVELKHAAAQITALTTQQARLVEQIQALEGRVVVQATELAREGQANDNNAGQIVALHTRQDELIQLADDRLADAHELRREKAALTDRVAQLDATAQDNWVALALLEQDRQSVAKYLALINDVH